MRTAFSLFAGLFFGVSVVYAQNNVLVNGNATASTAAAKKIGQTDSAIKTTAEAPATKRQAGQGKIVITGNRFSYPLIQKWIDEYSLVNPNVKITIESRGLTDPQQYDILSEVYEQDEATKKKREYLYIGRYAILPVANSKSAFAKTYATKGLTKELINQLFFHDLFADKEKEQSIKVPYTIYTRLQKAGAPIVFSQYFGYQQKDIKGTSIAGADEHLLKAVLRDSTGVTYLPLPLIYDHNSKKSIDGVVVLPVDFNGNGRIADDEKFYDDETSVINRIESKTTKEINNIPTGYLHLSVDKEHATIETLTFLRWVNDNGQKYLHAFGYLTPETGSLEKVRFEEFALKRINE